MKHQAQRRTFSRLCKVKNQVYSQRVSLPVSMMMDASDLNWEEKSRAGTSKYTTLLCDELKAAMMMMTTRQ